MKRPCWVYYIQCMVAIVGSIHDLYNTRWRGLTELLILIKGQCEGLYGGMSGRKFYSRALFVSFTLTELLTAEAGRAGRQEKLTNMAQQKLSMAKEDVEKAIALHVLNNYPNMKVLGQGKPCTIHQVLATIQDAEYLGASKYNVLLDFYGVVTDGHNGVKENEHYMATCVVIVTTNTENSPVIEINDSLILTKQGI